MKIVARLWRDSRAAVYTVVAATALAAWGVIHVNGFPKSKLDWSVVGWAAAAAALGAAGRYVDPVVAAFAKRAGLSALGGKTLMSQADIETVIQSLAKAQTDAEKKATS